MGRLRDMLARVDAPMAPPVAPPASSNVIVIPLPSGSRRYHSQLIRLYPVRIRAWRFPLISATHSGPRARRIWWFLNHVDVHFDSSFVKAVSLEAESAVRIPARMNGHFRDQHRSESVFTFDPKWLFMMGGRRAEPRRDQPRAVTPIDCRRISRTAFRFR
jgi:hypothetical protein